MNKQLLIGVIVGVGVAAGVGAVGLALKGHQEPQAVAAEQPAAPAGDTAQLDTSSPETATPAPEQAQSADAVAQASPPPVAPPAVEQAADPKFVRVMSVEPQNRTV